jgi:hypothetical protein
LKLQAKENYENIISALDVNSDYSDDVQDLNNTTAVSYANFDESLR